MPLPADQDLLQREIVALRQIRGQGALALETVVLSQGSTAQHLKRAGLKKAAPIFIKEKSQSTARAPGRREEAPLVLKGIALWQEDTEVEVHVAALLILMGEVGVRVQRRRGVMLMLMLMKMKLMTAAPLEAVNLPKCMQKLSGHAFAAARPQTFEIFNKSGLNLYT